MVLSDREKFEASGDPFVRKDHHGKKIGDATRDKNRELIYFAMNIPHENLNVGWYRFG